VFGESPANEKLSLEVVVPPLVKFTQAVFDVESQTVYVIVVAGVEDAAQEIDIVADVVDAVATVGCVVNVGAVAGVVAHSAVVFVSSTAEGFFARTT
jgi:hypothetical protein